MNWQIFLSHSIVLSKSTHTHSPTHAYTHTHKYYIFRSILLYYNNIPNSEVCTNILIIPKYISIFSEESLLGVNYVSLKYYYKTQIIILQIIWEYFYFKEYSINILILILSINNFRSVLCNSALYAPLKL